MIKLAMEIPTEYLPRWTPQTDIDFVLAHKVLADENYQRYYFLRPLSRILILDNSMHELGHPLPIRDLVEAAARVRADFVIPPDRLGDVDFNLASCYELLDHLWAKPGMEKKHGVAPVLCGRSREERIKIYRRYSAFAKMICLPFREERLSWFHDLLALGTFERIHLLGVNRLSELREFAVLAKRFPKTAWSVDTAKPIKLGAMGRRIDDGKDLRNVLPQAELLELTGLSTEQLELIDGNIDYLRRILQ